MLLEFKNVYKSFQDKEVLKGVSFKAESGKLNAYLGRNGSGKTTSFRLLLNIFKQDKGDILLDGEKIDPAKIKIGYLPEERGMYDGVGLVTQLSYFGRLKGMSKKEAIESAKKYLKFFDIKESKKKLKTLSKGNAQKIQIIQAVINDPDILILDEPFSGLDPINVGKLKEIIQDFVKRGKLVIFSSHQMPVVEDFCENINILEKGKILLSGRLDEIKKERSHKKMILKVANIEDEKLKEQLEKTPLNIEYSLEKEGVLLKFEDKSEKRELLKYLEKENLDIEEFTLFKPSLEKIFIETVGENNE